MRVFLLVPLTLTGNASALSPVATAGLLYFTIVLAILVMWVWQVPLGLSDKVLAQTALECLLCAPYTANLVRKISFTRRVDEDFLLAAERLTSEGQLRVARQQCLVRINEQIEMEVGDGSSTSTDLEAVSSTLGLLRMASARLTEEVADESE